MFIFPLKNLAREELMQINGPCRDFEKNHVAMQMKSMWLPKI